MLDNTSASFTASTGSRSRSEMIAFLSQFDAEGWLRIVSIRLSGAGELGMKGVFIRSLSTLVPQPQNADDHDG